MAAKKTNTFLNVFLIKESITALDKMIRLDKCDPPVEIPIAGFGTGKLFIWKSAAKLPKWASIFAPAIDIRKIGKTSAISAVFVIQVYSRYFVLAFGASGRFLVRNDVFEERFGLVTALNSVDKTTFRCIDKQSFDTIQSHTRIQSNEGTSPDQFGRDVEQDILKAIVGTPIDPSLGHRMTGMDSLSVTVPMDLSDLPYLLQSYRIKYELKLNDTDYQWVNNISQVNRPSALIDQLDEILVSKFRTDPISNLWISIPDIIQWELIKGFVYQGGKNIIYPDINLEGFLETVKTRDDISIDKLKNRRVQCADAEHNPVHNNWSIYKCIYAEVDHESQKYILTGGQWFRINNDFVTRTNKHFKEIGHSPLTLPVYNGGTEGAYNKSVAASHPDRYFLMDDKKRIFHGGGQGQVEFCDLFSKDKELIHIKKYGQSTVFSHLFSQGFVSGQLLQLDGQFRKK